MVLLEEEDLKSSVSSTLKSFDVNKTIEEEDLETSVSSALENFDVDKTSEN